MTPNQHFKKGDLVEIIWGDAWCSDGWLNLDSLHAGPKTLKHVGLVAVCDKEGVTLTFGLDGESIMSAHFIPWNGITKIKRINYKYEELNV